MTTYRVQRPGGFPALSCGGGQQAHSPGPCPGQTVVVPLNPTY